MNTCRRELLDRFLVEQQHLMTGTVLDIGGKKESKRGAFRPPLTQVESWRYANIDESTQPDYLCSAEALPLEDNSVDVFLMCEVLEHLENPELVLDEAFRILRPGGYGLLTMPFLYPIHADPFDFQRWTDTKLRTVLKNIGFEVTQLSPMGGTLAVVFDLAYVRLTELQKKSRLLVRVGMGAMKLMRYVLQSYIYSAHPKITTGFGMVVKKC
ncbi:MAG: methyltransferase domain-containing protein [Candidatus Scalindua sp.]